MWIFDWIIAEEQNTTITDSWILLTDSNEDASLIISDSQSEGSVVSSITTFDIPDSAISFFDESSETKIQEKAKIETDLFWEDVAIVDWSKEDLVISDNYDVKDVWNKTSLENTSISSKITQNNFVGTTTNPNEILANAIVSLEGFLVWHEESMNSKMTLIDLKQAEITTLKQDIKALNDEAKIIAEEKTKVEKMIELFNSQKI